MESFDFSKIFWFFHFKDNAIKCLACLCIYVYKIYKSKWKDLVFNLVYLDRKVCCCYY